MKNISKTIMLLTIILTTSATVFAKSAKSNTGYLGVYLNRMDRVEKKELGITHGILVIDVEDGSPAQKAGIAPDDVILYFNAKKIRTPEDLTRYVRGTDPETRVTLTIKRNGKKKEVTVILDKKKRAQFVWHSDFGRNMTMFSQKSAFLGVKLQALNKDLAPYFHAKENEGALVLEVVEESPASVVGLKAGDVIVQLDGDPIKTPEDVTDILEDFEAGDAVDVQVLRQGSKKEFTVELDENSGQFLDFHRFPMMHDKAIHIPDTEFDHDGCVMGNPNKH